MGEKKKRLTLYVSLLLITGFLVTSLTSYFVSRASLLEHLTLSELPLTSDNIYSEIQRDLLYPILISSLMSNDTFLRNWIVSGEENPEQVIEYLKAYQSKYGMFTSFLVSDRTHVYYQADGILKTVKPDDERDVWYFRVREMDPDFEINVDQDMAHKDTLTIFINYKVFDFDGDFLGATGVGINVNTVMELIEDYQQRYHRQVYFVNDEGQITLHGKNFDKTAGNIHEMEGISAISQQVLEADKDVFQYHHDGKTIHLNTRLIPELGWHLLVEQTEEETIRSILKTLVLNLILCSFITAIVLVLTNWTINAYQNRLETIATTDELTGLLNRRAFGLVFKQTLKNTQRISSPLSMIIFDIDHFKRVNDTYGHLAGDAVLRDIAKAAQVQFRESDILCRWGGEEFLVLLQDCALDHAYALAEKFRKTIEKSTFSFESQKISAAISLGTAQYRTGEHGDTLLNRADHALYAAKQKGRNRTEKEAVE